jgi:hypothetical protein
VRREALQAHWPFRVFSSAARRRALPPRHRPLVEFAARSECMARPRSALYWFCAPAAPFVLTPAVRSFADGLRRSQLSDRRALSSSFAFLQSIPRRNPASRSQPASHSHGLSFPSAHQDPAIHLPRALPRPAMVRLQGLATLLTVFARRTRVGLVSCRRRSWDSPFGVFSSRKVSAPFGPEEPTYRFSDRYTSRCYTTGRPGRPRFLGFGPSGSSSRAPRD